MLAPGAALAQHWQFDRGPARVSGASACVPARHHDPGGAAARSHRRCPRRQGGAGPGGRHRRRAEVSSEVSGNQRNTSADVDLTITVLDRFDVDLETMGGDIRITGVEGQLDGQTMGGAIVLHEVRGEVTLHTMGGKIRVTDSEADGKVSTMGGNVEFHNRWQPQGPRRRPSPSTTPTASAPEPATWCDRPWRSDPRQDRTGHAEVSTMGGNVTIESAGGPVDALDQRRPDRDRRSLERRDRLDRCRRRRRADGRQRRRRRYQA
ncbi:MAG: hypothetical protein R2862_02845 [Thermoanaerobaculia bacterium]